MSKRKARTPSTLDPFKAAQANAPAASSEQASEQTIWPVPADLAEVLASYLDLERQAKAITAATDEPKRKLKDYGSARLAGHLAQAGVMPPTPMKLSATAGACTYVLQAKAALCKEQQLLDLVGLLGHDPAHSLVHEAGEFAFNPAILDIPGVQAAVAKALQHACRSLITQEILTEEQAQQLVTFEAERRFVPAAAAQAPSVCGRDPQKIARYLDLLGSAATRFVRT